MSFRSYDALKLFDVVARHLSITVASKALNLSKGAVSYQIGKLETDLGFKLFDRNQQRISLTEKGQRLWHVSQTSLSQIDQEIALLRDEQSSQITIGALTYFFSRWLSPRLMDFMQTNPGVALRIEPITSPAELTNSGIDVAICWGLGDWENLSHSLIFQSPAKPTANASVAKQIQELGLENALQKIPLLADSSGCEGWRQWHNLAGFDYQPVANALVIPDSNDRVQAVIDGQGIALWDALVQDELDSDVLETVSDIALDSAGYYLVYPPGKAANAMTEAFADWVLGSGL